MDASVKLAGDFELWARFFSKEAELYAADVPLGIFRQQKNQRSATQFAEYLRESQEVLARYGGAISTKGESYILAKLAMLSRHFQKRYMKRLAGGKTIRRCVNPAGAGWSMEKAG